METFQSFNQNFDPASLANQTSSVIQFVVVLDKSGSVSSFKTDINNALSEVFMKELKNSHRKDDIVIKCIEFNEKVEHKSGFMPILSLTDDYLELVRPDGMTALYQAVLEAFEHVESYRKDLEDQGVDVRTCIFICTDGEDNSSPIDAANKVKQKVEELRKNESWLGSFSINMLGVGKASTFEEACRDMGLDPSKCLSTVSNNAQEIRKQMGVVSQSVSSSSAASAVTF